MGWDAIEALCQIEAELTQVLDDPTCLAQVADAGDIASARALHIAITRILVAETGSVRDDDARGSSIVREQLPISLGLCSLERLTGRGADLLTRNNTRTKFDGSQHAGLNFVDA